MQMCSDNTSPLPQHHFAFSHTLILSHTFGLSLHGSLHEVQLFSCDLVHRVSNELRALLFTFGNPVAPFQQVVVNFVSDAAVLFVLRVVRHELPHPLGHGHQLSCFTPTDLKSYAH